MLTESVWRQFEKNDRERNGASERAVACDHDLFAKDPYQRAFKMNMAQAERV